jgi:Tfp pilus assembly protein PilX
MTRHQAKKGSALIVVMVFCAVFATLAASYLAAANSNLQSARLQSESRRAQGAAESGLAFMRATLPQLDVSAASTSEETLQALAEGLNNRYQGTLFGDQTAVVQDDSVWLPAMVLNFPEGPAQVQLRIMAIGDNDYTLVSAGQATQCAKQCSISFQAGHDETFLAKFGLASRSRVSMTGNTKILGANDPKEGSVLSTTFTHSRAIDMAGNINISGDVSIVNPDGEIRMTGHAAVDGDIQIGVDNPEFPEIDTSPFEPYATNTVGPGTKTSGNCYFENIRVLAGTNPTFTGNTTIRGVIYIESPNKVRFTGNLNMVGVIVCEDPGDTLDLNNHYMHFTGNSSFGNVSELPGGAQFDGLRDMAGAFLLAPGYETKFTGNFRTVGGTIAASQFKFTGNASGTIKGSVLNLDDTDFVMTGNSRLTIDHDGLEENPIGLTFPRTMIYVPGSYSE